MTTGSLPTVPPGLPAHPPVRLVVTDDLERPRVTVFFRLLLALPHLLWLGLLTLAAFVIGLLVWMVVLVRGRAPLPLHDFLALYVRYSTHVGAYVNLVGSPYPGFTGNAYTVDVEIDPPRRQGRLGAAVRLVLSLPALLLASTLAGSGAISGSSLTAGGGVLAAVGLLGWFASLARRRMPEGLRDLGAYALGYAAHATAYLLLLTDRYPTSNPAVVAPLQRVPTHPVRIDVADPLDRSRLTVFFRALLTIPHLVWLILWSVPVAVALVAGWVIALVTGRLPASLHRFLAAFTRYTAHVYAYLFLVGGPFPGFVGAAGSYPITLTISPRERQHRLVTFARPLLAIPAFVVAGAYGGVLLLVGLLGFWAALVSGRMPEGLRNLGASAIRYNAQVGAYVLLLTDRYPYSCPSLTAVSDADDSTGVPVVSV